jgi:hypothetical protein
LYAVLKAAPTWLPSVTPDVVNWDAVWASARTFVTQPEHGGFVGVIIGVVLGWILGAITVRWKQRRVEAVGDLLTIALAQRRMEAFGDTDSGGL